MEIRDHNRAASRFCLLTFLALCCAGCGLSGAKTTDPPVPVAPSVSITSPASGATVSATVSVTTSVSSNTTSVQFEVDGVHSGAALTSAPFSLSLNTTALSNGSHSLTAVASNSAAQTTTSAAIAIIVSNPHLAITTTSLPSGQVQTGYSASLQAAAGTPPYTWSVSSGQLPTTLLLSSSAGIISGIPTMAGSFSFTVQVTDSAGGSASAGFSINIATVAPTVSITSPVSGATVSGTVSVTTSVSSNTTSVQFEVDGSHVAGAVTSAPFSLSLNTATLSNGSHSLTAVATNSAAQATTSSAVAIIVNNPHLAITTTSLPSGQVQSSYSAPLKGTAGTPPYTWSAASGQLPPPLLLSSSTGIISGIPTMAGSFSFTVQVTDSAGGSASAGFSINIATVAPTVSITSPVSGATVSGTVSVTTSVSSNTTSVQFAVDGSNSGAAVTSAPFSLSLDTKTLSNASHMLTAVASNSAAQTTTSAAVAITVNNPPPAPTSPFGHVLIVAMENNNYADVVGSPSMPYFNGLANQYGLATQYFSNIQSSIGAYFIWTTGQILTTDGNQTPLTFPVSVDNVVREVLAAGKTWKQYAESIPSVGYLGGDATGPDGGAYVARHVPLNYMTDVQGSPTQRLNIVPFTQFATDLAGGALPDYSFITPNMCDDAHDCSLSVGDAWLKAHIDPLIKSAQFQNDGLLVIAFDESANDNTHGGGHVAAVIVSPFSKNGYQSTTFYQGESVLRLMLEGLGIKTLPGAAATAPAMWEFFTFSPPS